MEIRLVESKKRYVVENSLFSATINKFLSSVIKRLKFNN